MGRNYPAEANCRLASQEIPSLQWIRKVYGRVRRSKPLVRIRKHINKRRTLFRGMCVCMCLRYVCVVRYQWEDDYECWIGKVVKGNLNYSSRCCTKEIGKATTTSVRKTALRAEGWGAGPRIWIKNQVPTKLRKSVKLFRGNLWN
jgi:hypothetical protein